MELTHYLKLFPSPGKPGRVVLYSTRRCALLEVSEALLERARSGNLAEQEQETLTQLGFLTPSHAEEREELRNSFARVNRERRSFNVIVTLTLECNLACPYCYEDGFRGKYAMSSSTADLVVECLRARMADGLSVSVSFYGGEALMALPLLKNIASRLGAAARHSGVVFDFNLVTNGTLLSRATVEELLPLGLNGAKITLDGPQVIHDQQRPFVSGKGSFERIVESIKETSDLLPLQVGGNYTRHNYRRFPELLDDFLAKGIMPDKLQFVMFTPVTPRADGSIASGDVSAVCACTEEPWMIEASLFLRKEILQRGFNTRKLRPSGCMIEFDNDLVIGYDGGLYKCPAFMGDETLRIGSLADGVGDYAQSHGLDVWKCDECLDCSYLPLCYGGCRFLTKLRTGAMNVVDCRRKYLAATLEQILVQDMTLR